MVENNIYWLWLLCMGSLIFLMQAGFFLLEGGQVRSRDVSNVLMKMNGHIGIGAIVFLLFGFAIKQYGWPVALLAVGMRWPWQFWQDGAQSISFFVSLAFALVSCAIPSGSFSGRMRFSAYLLFAALYVGLAYPVFAYLLWNGPLARLGVQDYAGSLGVHAVGGMMGLVGASFLGRRESPAAHHDVPMMGFGALLLMFCWFGFNLGSVPSYGNIRTDLPLVVINTVGAMAGGIAGSMLISKLLGGKSHPIITPNGGLAGAVAICSGVHLVSPLFAVGLGMIAGAQIPLTSKWLSQRLHLDDPCDVGAVHAIPGLLGGIAAGLWSPMIPNGFHGYTVSLWAQLVGTLAAVTYGLLAAFVIFTVIDKTIGLRVSKEAEALGLDLAAHGVAAYPELAPDANPLKPLHVFSAVKISQVMRETVSASPYDSVEKVLDLMLMHQTFVIPVLGESSELCGVITSADVSKIERSERANVRVKAVYTREVQFAFPDQTVHEVIERMREKRLANFPVVSRQDDRRLLGMVAKSDLVSTYRDLVMQVQ